LDGTHPRPNATVANFLAASPYLKIVMYSPSRLSGLNPTG
jgi:hypothetical protein